MAIDRDLDGPTHRLHARTADDSTVYVEVVSGSGFVDHPTIVAEQTEALQERFDDVTIGRPSTMEVAGRLATAFDVEGTLAGITRTRRFVIIDGPAHTFRIVIDPTSEANLAALDDLSFTNPRP